jgi:hypothetical protein
MTDVIASPRHKALHADLAEPAVVSRFASQECFKVVLADQSAAPC